MLSHIFDYDCIAEVNGESFHITMSLYKISVWILLQEYEEEQDNKINPKYKQVLLHAHCLIQIAENCTNSKVHAEKRDSLVLRTVF